MTHLALAALAVALAYAACAAWPQPAASRNRTGGHVDAIDPADLTALELTLRATGLALRVERLGRRLPDHGRWALLTAADINTLASHATTRPPPPILRFSASQPAPA